MDWGSMKSLTQATFGHTFGWFFGVSQNFVYMTSWSTGCRLTLKPSCGELVLDHLGRVVPGGAL